MKLPQLSIETKPFILESQSTWHKLEVEQPMATIDIQQPHAEINMKTTIGKLTIDQTQAWEDMELKHIFRVIEEASDRGKQEVMEGIARFSEEGDELMKIENKYDALSSVIENSSMPKMREFNIGFIPSHFSVKINYTPRTLDIDVKANKPIINSRANPVNLTYVPGDLNFQIKQYNSITIDVKG